MIAMLDTAVEEGTTLTVPTCIVARHGGAAHAKRKLPVSFVRKPSTPSR